MHKDLLLGSLAYSIYRLQQCEFLLGNNVEKGKREGEKGKQKLPCCHLERTVMVLPPVQPVMMFCHHAFC